MRSDSACTIYPGEFLKMKVPPQFTVSGDKTVFVSPRPSTARMNFVDTNCTRVESQFFPLPQITHIIDGHVYLPNSSDFPVNILKNQHLADLRVGSLSEENVGQTVTEQYYPRPKPSIPVCQVEDVILDPDNLLSDPQRKLFKKVLYKFKDSFSSKLGRYNGVLGNMDAKIVLNNNSIEPPSFPCRKFNQPEALNKKQQEVMDGMEADGILVRPEDVGILPTHVHPSFMVPKMDDGKFTGKYRLVTGLSSLSPFLKPSRVPLPTIEEAFRKISSWKYLVLADLKSWHWQIPIDKESMRFFGTSTPYGGLRLYAFQPMGYLNANENADLVIQNVLFPAIRDDKCVRIADNLITGGPTPEIAAKNFHLMLQLCSNSGLTFKASKTIICPRSVAILEKFGSKEQ